MVAVIEDEEMVRTALERLLRTAGYSVADFASAEAFLNARPVSDARCLIADVRMPGMSGLDLQSRLNDEGDAIPIIFISAHGDEDLRIRAMKGGAVAFLAKPFERTVLLKHVRTCLESR